MDMKRVTTIPASVSKFVPINQITNKRRVAGYARVSTDSEEQLTSYEAQVDYYTNYIKNRSDWDFVNVYTDEGISATTTKKREGFNRMIEDALSGHIDLIITKSVSRFARNTVDSLSTIRKLKEKAVEVYFEKENIWTFDGKGELLITIMSSLAQEESRSISENCTWGQRKRFADGKVTVPFERFLGYDRGEDGNLVVNEEQAIVVKRIYRMFLQGYSSVSIARILENEKVPTPSKTGKWSSNTIRSILSNEKYKGDALLQKSYTVDYLTKTKKKNEGEIAQYYVTGNHEAIINPSTFDRVQKIMETRKTSPNRASSVSIFSNKIKCGDCGYVYGPKVWHSNSKYKQRVWQCNNKFKKEKKCKTSHLTDDKIKELFLKAINQLVKHKKEIIENHREISSKLFDTSKLEKEKIKLEEELNRVVEEVNKCINRNARQVQNQDEYNVEYAKLVNKFNSLEEKIKKLKNEILEKKSKKEEIDIFIKELDKQELLSEFEDNVWLNTVDFLIVYKREKVEFNFLDGSKVKLEMKDY